MRKLPRTLLALPPSALLLAGCGGSGPHLARSDAAPLIALAQRIPSEQPCAQARDIRALQAKTIVLVNAHRVPARLQETLMSGVTALRTQMPVCLPPVVTTTPAAAPPPAPSKHDHGKHGHGHGKHGGGEGD
jgi:hypothetical protein